MESATIRRRPSETAGACEKGEGNHWGPAIPSNERARYEVMGAEVGESEDLGGVVGDSSAGPAELRGMGGKIGPAIGQRVVFSRASVHPPKSPIPPPKRPLATCLLCVGLGTVPE